MRRVLGFAFFILSGSACLLLSSSTAADPSASQLKSEVEKLKKDPDLAHGMLGIYVLDIKKDSVLVDHNGSTGLVPASALKTVTTAAALCLLGEKFRYGTWLEHDGQFDTLTGVLKGNLYIKGSGDPALGSKYFPCTGLDCVPFTGKWAQGLRNKGLKHIEGAVVADASVMEDGMVSSTWIWSDIGNYYGAGACGINYRDNLYTVYFKTGGTGDSARIVRIDPEIPGMKIINAVKAYGTEDNCYIYGAPYHNKRYATGTVPPHQQEYGVDGSMPDPPLFLAHVLDTAIRFAGIKVAKEPSTVRELKLKKAYAPAKRNIIDSVFSPPLSDIVYWTNRNSVNLYAEALLKTIGLKQAGMGSDGAGTAALTQFWAGKGIDTQGMYLNDGSGLSRWNSITCKQLAMVMKVMSKEKTFGIFYKSLPRQNASVAAKSGYIARVRSYAGYVTKKNGDLLAFAMIANNYDCTAKEMRIKLEKLMEALTKL
ncbi:MAG: D-alanyl-D-alanine carboxypeptidase/D-alanyl-D-alanine-endopeptidase [Bacteroidota bacterium]